VLAAFEAVGWPQCIECPPPAAARQSKTAQAVKALNCGHRAVVLRFRGNGTGRCICWETIAVLTRICSSVPIKLNREHSQAGWTDIASTEASGVAEVLIDGLGTRMQSSFIAVGNAGEGVLTVANDAVIELSENLRAAAGGTGGLGHGQIVVRDGGEISAGQSFSIGRTSRGEMSVLSGGNAIADTINQLSIGALGRVELATGGKINDLHEEAAQGPRLKTAVDFDASGASFVSESLSYDAAFMDGVYTITVVPEPCTTVMAAIGALALAAVVWRRSSQRSTSV